MSKSNNFTAQVGDDGRITIPATTRKLLGIIEDDFVNVTIAKEE